MADVAKVGYGGCLPQCSLQINGLGVAFSNASGINGVNSCTYIAKAIKNLPRKDVFKIARKELVDYNNRVESQILSFSNKIGLKDKFLKLTKNTRTILSVITIALNIACLICPVVALASTIVNVTALLINLAMLVVLYFISNKDKALLVSMSGIAISIIASFWPANLIGQAISFIGSAMNFCGFLSYTWSSRRKQKVDAKINDKEGTEIVACH